ncbi:hypothetical protein [Neobacillus sp. FSL H8-0543]|uniref:hypothetical protein n=1 Tax=Neobacillus sp. FSL H8-0543 TaxID=2954672 RepID=UPI00315911C5
MKFKIHRCNCRNIWSVQNRKTKLIVSSILLNGKWSTEIKPERIRNPKGFVTTTSSQDIILNPALELVEQYIKVEQLIYDKRKVNFNLKEGENLYFADDGSCYVVKKG